MESLAAKIIASAIAAVALAGVGSFTYTALGTVNTANATTAAAMQQATAALKKAQSSNHAIRAK